MINCGCCVCCYFIFNFCGRCKEGVLFFIRFEGYFYFGLFVIFYGDVVLLYGGVGVEIWVFGLFLVGCDFGYNCCFVGDDEGGVYDVGLGVCGVVIGVFE